MSQDFGHLSGAISSAVAGFLINQVRSNALIKIFVRETYRGHSGEVSLKMFFFSLINVAQLEIRES